jgi:hypothetical protein
VEARAGFVLNGVGVVLQVVYVLLHAGVFVLQLLDLLLEFPVFEALLFIRGDAVLANDDMIAQKDCEGDGCGRGNAATHAVCENGGADEIRVLCDLLHYSVRAPGLKPLFYPSGLMHGLKAAPTPLCSCSFFFIGGRIDSINRRAHNYRVLRFAQRPVSLPHLSSKFFFHLCRQAEVLLYGEKEPTSANYFVRECLLW